MRLTSSFLKYLIAPCILSVLVGSVVSSDAQLPGFVEGHVKIFPLSDVNLADDAAATNAVTTAPYGEYPLTILSQDGKREVMRVTADGNGNYRVELPPGNYVLDIQRRPRGRVRATPQPFTVVSGQTVHVDMNIDTGIR
jgi:hypothetical protein